MTWFARFLSRKKTPQSEPIPGREADMVQNSAGGFSFPVDCWTRLERFLILGTEGGSYYASERQLTRENAKAVEECLLTDAAHTIKTIIAISEDGRAPKNTTAIFALALGSVHHIRELTEQNALNRVCRTATHLFQFLEMVSELRGNGHGLNSLVRNWYEQSDIHRLAFQVTKYRSRGKWNQRSVLRKFRPVGATPAHGALYRWAVHGMEGMGTRTVDRTQCKNGAVTEYPAVDPALLPEIVHTFEEIKKTTKKAAVVRLIREKHIPREFLEGSHGELLNDPEVWDALLERMPLMAMVRNLGKMSQVGLIKPLSAASKLVVSRLSDGALIRKSRLHPLALLMTQSVYAAGRSPLARKHRGGEAIVWTPDNNIVDALDDAFHLAFKAVVPADTNHLIGLDVSGSMGMGQVAGTFLTPRVAAAAMAMVTLRTEPWTHIIAFSDKVREIQISASARLDEVVRRTSTLPFGGTDCALPMIYALKNKLDVDTFHVLTDSETWAGDIQPVQALRQYRREMNKPHAKLIVVGMVSNGFTIADPQDGGMLDVVGFDTATPVLMADFARGGPPPKVLSGYDELDI